MDGTMGHHDGLHSGILELGSLKFRMISKDQADIFIKTREALAEHFGRQLSYKMLLLESTGHETVYSKPIHPVICATRSTTQGKASDSPALSLRLEGFKAELANCNKDQCKYDKDRASVFGLIVAKCFDVVKPALESNPAYTIGGWNTM